MLISEFIVLRHPEWNYDTLKRGMFPYELPQLQRKDDTLLYHGIERLPWFDFNEGYYEEMIDDHMKNLWKKVHDNDWYYSSEFTPCDSCEIKKILDYSNLVAQICFSDAVGDHLIDEVLAVRSEYRESTIKFEKSRFDHDFTNLGYDVTGIGGGSFLFWGMYMTPFEHLVTLSIHKWAEKLNEYGLFDTLLDAQGYAMDYLAESKCDNLEFFGDQFDYPIVYRVKNMFD